MKPDIQKRLFEHKEALLQCEGWAKKAVAARDAGDEKRAKLYEAKAKACMKRMLRLEGK